MIPLSFNQMKEKSNTGGPTLSTASLFQTKYPCPASPVPLTAGTVSPSPGGLYEMMNVCTMVNLKPY